jgi:hypothetical protein
MPTPEQIEEVKARRQARRAMRTSSSVETAYDPGSIEFA